MEEITLPAGYLYMFKITGVYLVEVRALLYT